MRVKGKEFFSLRLQSKKIYGLEMSERWEDDSSRFVGVVDKSPRTVEDWSRPFNQLSLLQFLLKTQLTWLNYLLFAVLEMAAAVGGEVASFSQRVRVSSGQGKFVRKSFLSIIDE